MVGRSRSWGCESHWVTLYQVSRDTGLVTTNTGRLVWTQLYCLTVQNCNAGLFWCLELSTKCYYSLLTTQLYYHHSPFNKFFYFRYHQLSQRNEFFQSWTDPLKENLRTFTPETESVYFNAWRMISQLMTWIKMKMLKRMAWNHL